MNITALICAAMTLLHLFIAIKGEEESRSNSPASTQGGPDNTRSKRVTVQRKDQDPLDTRPDFSSPDTTRSKWASNQGGPDNTRSKRVTVQRYDTQEQDPLDTRPEYKSQQLLSSKYKAFKQGISNFKSIKEGISQFKYPKDGISDLKYPKQGIFNFKYPKEGKKSKGGVVKSTDQEEGRIKRLTVPSFTAPNNYSGPGNEYGSTNAYTVDENEKNTDLRLSQTDFANMGYDEHLRSIGQNKTNYDAGYAKQTGYDVGVDKNKNNFEDIEMMDETGYEKLSQMDQLNYDNAQHADDDIGSHFEHAGDTGTFPQYMYGDHVEYEGHFDIRSPRFQANKHVTSTQGQGQVKGQEVKSTDSLNEAEGHSEGHEGHLEGHFDGGHGGGGHGGGGDDGGGHVSYQAGHSIKIVKVPHIIKYTVIKKVPYKVEIPVPAPYGVPYDVPREVYVKKPVQIEIYKPYVVHVGKPYHVTEHKLVEIPVVKKVPYTVHKAIKVPYPHKIYVKKPIYITKHSTGGHKG